MDTKTYLFKNHYTYSKCYRRSDVYEALGIKETTYSKIRNSDIRTLTLNQIAALSAIGEFNIDICKLIAK